MTQQMQGCQPAKLEMEHEEKEGNMQGMVEFGLSDFQAAVMMYFRKMK